MTVLHTAPFDMAHLYDWLRILVSRVITHVAVPIFYMISGYLFFINVTRWDKSTYAKKMQTRFKTLVIPYVCWNAFAIVLHIFIACLIYHEPLSYIPDFLTRNGILMTFWNYASSGMPINQPLWFVRDLIVIVLLSPLLYLYLRKLHFLGVILLFFLYMTDTWPAITGFSIFSIFFFSIGAYMGIFKMDIVQELLRFEKISYSLAIPLILLLTWFNGNDLLMVFFTVAGSCSAFCLTARLLKRHKSGIVGKLQRTTFFIFAAHSRVIAFSGLVLSYVLPWNSPPSMIAKYLLSPLLTTTICIASYFILKRVAPRFLSIINGNRL